MVKIKFIAIEQLLEMMENKEKFILVDALSEESFKQGHIPGAVNIPGDKVQKLAPKLLKKSDKIIVYCASYTCHASTYLARALIQLGYKNILDFKAGKQGWVNSGMELEK